MMDTTHQNLPASSSFPSSSSYTPPACTTPTPSTNPTVPTATSPASPLRFNRAGSCKLQRATHRSSLKQRPQGMVIATNSKGYVLSASSSNSLANASDAAMPSPPLSPLLLNHTNRRRFDLTAGGVEEKLKTGEEEEEENDESKAHSEPSIMPHRRQISSGGMEMEDENAEGSTPRAANNINNYAGADNGGAKPSPYSSTTTASTTLTAAQCPGAGPKRHSATSTSGTASGEVGGRQQQQQRCGSPQLTTGAPTLGQAILESIDQDREEPVRPPTTRVFKFDNNSADQSSGRIVDIGVDDSELVLYSTTCEKNPQVETIFIDEILDVYIGNHNDSSKAKNESQLQRVFAASFASASAVLADCVVTVVHAGMGQDPITNPQLLTFFTRTPDEARSWRRELRRYSQRHHRERVYLDAFYYWCRHFAALRCTLEGRAAPGGGGSAGETTSAAVHLSVESLLSAVLPSAKQKEERRLLEKVLLRTLPVLKERKKATTRLLADEAFLHRLYKVVTGGRRDVEDLFLGRFTRGAPTSVDFRRYLNAEHRDKRLNEVLHPPMGDESAAALIHRYESSCGHQHAQSAHIVPATSSPHNNSSSPHNNHHHIQSQQVSRLSEEGFLRFLLSADNLALHPGGYELQEERLKKPLAHYFIYSSHNTYLKGRQVRSRASVSMYRYALLSGCRSVELDCWDGPGNEPIITHGPTHICFCTTILFKDVLQAIVETAFVTSDYPVVLSLENHCSQKQQVRMAHHCRKIFGELLLSDTLEEFPIRAGTQLPSPHVLRRKILIKNKIETRERERRSATAPSDPAAAATTTNPTGDGSAVKVGGGPLGGGSFTPRMGSCQLSEALSKQISMESGRSTDEELLVSSSAAAAIASSTATAATLDQQQISEGSSGGAIASGSGQLLTWRRQSKEGGVLSGEGIIEEETRAASATVATTTAGGEIVGGGDGVEGGKPPDRTAISPFNEEDSTLISTPSKKASTATIGGGGEGGLIAGSGGSGSGSQQLVTELSNLVTYMRAMGKFTSFIDCEARAMSAELYSMNETKGLDLVKQHAEQFVNHNKRQITRVYPRGSRVDSSNYMPLVFWNCGCQMAALNMQTADLSTQLNAALFEMNGRCGYVLKPACMRKPNAKFDPFELDRVENVVPMSLAITIISGQLFSLLFERRTSVYVEVDLYGLPGDSHKKLFRTRSIPTDGLNTLFIDSKLATSSSTTSHSKPHNQLDHSSTFIAADNTSTLPSQQQQQTKFSLEKILLPAMAFVRFGVYDAESGGAGGRLLGQRILPVSHLQSGYKHIVLRDPHDRPLGPVTLFVHVDVQDYVSDAHRDLVDMLQNPIEAMSRLAPAAVSRISPLGSPTTKAAHSQHNHHQPHEACQRQLSREEKHNRLLEAMLGSDGVDAGGGGSGGVGGGGSGGDDEAASGGGSTGPGGGDDSEERSTGEEPLLSSSFSPLNSSRREKSKRLAGGTFSLQQLHSGSNLVTSPPPGTPPPAIGSDQGSGGGSFSRESPLTQHRGSSGTTSSNQQAKGPAKSVQYADDTGGDDSSCGGGDQQPPATTTTQHQQPQLPGKLMQRKYTVLSEFAASRQRRFRLERFDVALPSLTELEQQCARLQKSRRTLAKRYPGLLESVDESNWSIVVATHPEIKGNDGKSDDVGRATEPSGGLVGNGGFAALPMGGGSGGSLPSATHPQHLDKTSTVAMTKFIKEKSELITALIEQTRKKTLKALEAEFQRETKELQQANAKARLDELSGTKKRDNPIEYKRLSDKYVRRGIEENRKLLVIKSRKVDELNGAAHSLRMALGSHCDELMSHLDTMT